MYDTEKPNQKPKQIDLLKLAKKAGDEDYLNQVSLRLFMLNEQAYLQMPFGASSADFASNKKYLNLKTQKIEEMNISANSNTLYSELDYANVDMRKTLEPFGLEMWTGATNGRDLDHPTETPIASLPALYYISEKDRSLNMDSTNFAKEHKDAYEAIKTKHARIYTIPSKINNETWFNTLLHWMASEGQDAYELPVRAFRPTQEEGKVKSYQELQTWNDNHIRKK